MITTVAKWAKLTAKQRGVNMIKIASIKHNEHEKVRCYLHFDKEKGSIIGRFHYNGELIEESLDIKVKNKEEAIKAVQAMYSSPLWDLKYYC